MLDTSPGTEACKSGASLMKPPNERVCRYVQQQDQVEGTGIRMCTGAEFVLEEGERVEGFRDGGWHAEQGLGG